MLISEVAKATGLPKDTIRYYTKLGLIKAGDKDAGSRVYADYDETVIEILTEIKLAKSAGFTLNELRVTIREWNDGKLSDEDVVEIFTRKLKEVGQKKRDLTQIENILKAKIEKYKKLT